jgi:uncharacterized membrane protein YsdA (DUF1294 family)/cold shock CspA family protein
MRHKGRIIEWNDDKGFGFVTPAVGGDRVFIHIKSFVNRRHRPVSGDIVTYETSTDAKGRPQGARISLSGDPALPVSSSGPGAGSLVCAALFLAVVVGLVVTRKLPTVALFVYFLGSAATFVVYAWDKAAARSNDWRVQEGTLQILSLLGGWPGALVAQCTLRHKSRKHSFQVVFWVTVALNCCALLFLLVKAPFST